MKFLLCFLLFAQVVRPVHSQSNFHSDPLKVKLITTDVTNFWKMYNQLNNATNEKDSLSLIQSEYLDRASAGLKELSQKKNYAFTSADLLYAINRYPNYLKSIERSSATIDAYKPSILKAFQKLKRIYPEARFPDFYFAFGIFGSGGTGIPSGMFIGAEIETADKTSPLHELPVYLQAGVKTVDKISLICSHELIHFQQKDNPENLLGAAIHEGACDFIGELISGGLINEYQHQYGNSREAEIWKKFKAEMNGPNKANWLYNGGSIKDLPADMGYYVGYKICKAYYQKAKNKHQALIDILTIKDYHKFLEQSGYENMIEKPLRNQSYVVNLTLSPLEKKLQCQTAINFYAFTDLPDTLRLLLHKEALITSVKLNGKNTDFLLQPSDKPSNRYMPESRNLLIFPFEKKPGNQTLQIEYGIVFNELKQNNSSFTSDWISLASYSSWYPVNYDWGDFSFTITAMLPPSYKLSGTGMLTRKGNTWKLAQTQKSSDMVLVASNKMQTKLFSDKGAQIRLDYLDYTSEEADTILTGTAQAYRFFSAKFGAIKNSALTIVATPRKGGSAFSRLNFFYMQTKGQSSFEVRKTISHEVAHFWWNTGDGEIWEDWLNESFAEFSTLLFVKQQQGTAAYQAILDEYKKTTNGLSPVWGLNRSDNNASLILYYKGSLVLDAFMTHVGEDAFFNLLRKMHELKISSTAALLSLVQGQISADAAAKLEMLLKQ